MGWQVGSCLVCHSKLLASHRHWLCTSSKKTMHAIPEVTKSSTSSPFMPLSSTIPEKLTPLSLVGANYKMSQIQGSNPTHTGLHLLLSSTHKDLLLRQLGLQTDRGGSGGWHIYSKQGVTPHRNQLPIQIKASTYTPENW